MENIGFFPDRYRTAAQEDRCAPRTHLMIPASLRPSGSRAFETIIRNLSISGFSATSPTRLHHGAICWLTLPGLGALQAEVAWWDNSMVGCGFSNLMSPIILDDLLDRCRHLPTLPRGL